MIGIYKITSPSNKVYIGQSWNLIKREKDYKSLANIIRQRKIYNSMKKYGVDKHIFEILHILSDTTIQKELDYWEIYYWKYFISQGFEMLNIKEPGKGGRLDIETKEKISKSNKGRIRSEEVMSKIKNLDRYNLPILMLNLNGKIIREFRNINSCSRELHVSSSNIKSVMNGKTKTCLSHIFIKKVDYDESKFTQIIVPGGCTEVNQYDLDNNFIKSFLSFKNIRLELELKIGCDPNIIRACKSENRIAYGFKWKYKN